MEQTGNGGQIVDPRKMAVARYQAIEAKLKTAETRIQKTLPKNMVAGMLVQIIMNSMTKNPKLLECTPASILGCALTAASLGLKPDGITGEAHLVPFYNTKRRVMEAQFIPGYKGLVQLAMRTGQVKRFQARAVFEGDLFEYAMGTTEYIKHKPMGKSDKATDFYAILEMQNGGLMFDVMNTDQVNAVRDNSANWKTAVKFKSTAETIWHKHYAEMGMKTVIRKLAKFAPVSSEFQMAISLEERLELLGRSQDMEQVAIDENTDVIEKLQTTGNTIESNYESLEFEDLDTVDFSGATAKADKALKETEKGIKEGKV